MELRAGAAAGPYGERFEEEDWRALEAARSLDQFIDRSRATSLRRFTERFNARLSSHAMERTLRAAWRDYVAEVAGWVGRIGGPSIAVDFASFLTCP